MADGGARVSLWRLWRSAIFAWVALGALLTLTCTLAYLPLAGANLVVSLAIAGVKAAIIVFVFMRLSEPKPLHRLAAVAGLAWLFIMFLLTGADYFTR